MRQVLEDINLAFGLVGFLISAIAWLYSKYFRSQTEDELKQSRTTIHYRDYDSRPVSSINKSHYSINRPAILAVSVVLSISSIIIVYNSEFTESLSLVRKTTVTLGVAAASFVASYLLMCICLFFFNNYLYRILVHEVHYDGWLNKRIREITYRSLVETVPHATIWTIIYALALRKCLKSQERARRRTRIWMLAK